MTDKKALRKKIEKELNKSKESFPFFKHGSRVYFYSASGYLVSLPQSYFFQRLDSLRRYFKAREPKEAQKLILENLSIFAQRFNDKEYPIPKITVFRDSCFGITFKIENYAEDDPIFGDDKDIMFKRSLTDARGNVLSDIEENSWNSAKEREDPRIEELCKEVLRKLRKGLKI